jgi:hypothetical protein
MQLRRSASDDDLELWELADETAGWSRRGRLDLGVRPPIQMEYRPFTVDSETGRLVMSRLTVTSQLVIFDGVDLDRW